MVKTRYLDGTGKGEFLYDYKYDILTFKIRDRDYKMSIELQNISLDIDTEHFITGIRISDVSKVSGLSKIVFKNLVHGEFSAAIKGNVITVQLSFVGKMRNKIIPLFSHEKNFTQQVTASLSPMLHLEDSVVRVPEIVA